jgi:hypothetical protein
MLSEQRQTSPLADCKTIHTNTGKQRCRDTRRSDGESRYSRNGEDVNEPRACGKEPHLIRSLPSDSQRAYEFGMSS